MNSIRPWFALARENHTIRLQLMSISLLLGLWALSCILSWVTYGQGERPLLPVRIGSLTRMLFTPADQAPFSLERTGKDWALVSYDLRYPAFEGRIEHFNESLQSLRGVEMLGEERESYHIPGVPSLILYQGDREVEALFVGSRNTLKREIYIARESDNKVFLVPDIFSPVLTRGLDSLVDNQLFPDVERQDLILMKTEPLVASAQELPLTEPITYTRTLTGWKSSQGDVPPSAVFSAINSLKAIEVLPALPLGGEPHYQITLIWANNREEILKVYSGAQEQLLIELAGSPYGYLIDPALLKQFYPQD